LVDNVYDKLDLRIEESDRCECSKSTRRVRTSTYKLC
jgi:hypothetical protein